ncbi:hypothetical protein SAMN05421736_107185 [Evansella caseinilytica]|uniref:Uncharacterized protein n=1 Tax=Evansella caseinilytica TaxID=1503961 RepID=A0A1H3R3K4_9BACI|nr:hypothetical protein SAMN05421736_107185 [Evansella caseinilytica]
MDDFSPLTGLSQRRLLLPDRCLRDALNNQPRKRPRQNIRVDHIAKKKLKTINEWKLLVITQLFYWTPLRIPNDFPNVTVGVLEMT